MGEKIEETYGAWPSPITSPMLTDGSIELVEVKLDPSDKGKGVVYWTEIRYQDSGRCVVCSRSIDGTVIDWTPPEFSVRTTVHEYGGGSFLVDNGVLYFSNFHDQRLYKQESPNKMPIPITPVVKGWRFADGHFHDGKIYCIREDHAGCVHGKSSSSELKGSPEPKNSIVLINVSTYHQHILAEGADFYACPKVSPNGQNLIWMQWNHPNMPWNDTEIWLANLLPNGHIQPGTNRKILGSPGINFMQPRFSPDNTIFFISDHTNFWNVFKLSDSGQIQNVHPIEKECGGPHWTFSNFYYVFDPNNPSDMAACFNGELAIINLKSSLYYKQETKFTKHQSLCFGQDSCVYCIASSPLRFPCLIRWNIVKGTLEIIRESRPGLPESTISTAQHIQFPTGENSKEKAYGYYYSPKNSKYKGRANTLPPLVVMAHGGPTSQAFSTLDIRKQYLTTRGFAVLDVNYRGSTGYGRAFRQALQFGVGLVDVEDVCNGALHLIKEKKVDKTKLCITGGSAGGYIVLAALASKNLFRVGSSHFGIADLELLHKTMHKFESRYYEWLIGPYPEFAAEYGHRSPINNVDRLNCPIVFFQGDNDTVVPKCQAEMMNSALKKKGLPTGLAVLEGEGHGFRIDHNIQLSIEGEYYFFCRVLGIPCTEPQNVQKLNIVNLPAIVKG